MWTSCTLCFAELGNSHWCSTWASKFHPDEDAKKKGREPGVNSYPPVVTLALGRVWFLAPLACGSGSWFLCCFVGFDDEFNVERAPSPEPSIASRHTQGCRRCGKHGIGYSCFSLPYSTIEMMWTTGSALADDKIVVLGIVASLLRPRAVPKQIAKTCSSMLTFRSSCKPSRACGPILSQV